MFKSRPRWSDALPAQQAWSVPTRCSRRFADEIALQRRNAIDDAQPEVTHDADGRHIVGEQSVEHICRNPHPERVESAPDLIALEHVDGSDVETQPVCLDDRFGECGDVLETEIEPLTGNRMDSMGGITGKRQPGCDERAGKRQAEWKRPAIPGGTDGPELVPEAAFEFRLEDEVVGCNEPVGSLGPFGPDERRTIALERQNGEGAGR